MKNIFLNSRGLIFFIFLTIAITGSGQVTFNAASTKSGVFVSSIDWQHTCTGTDRLLVVSVSTYDAADSVSSITYNGIALTKKISMANTDLKWYRAEQWYLVNPPSNSNYNILIIGSNAMNYIDATATSYTGVDQSTPTGNSNKASGSNSDTSLVAVNCGTNNMVVDVVSASRLIKDCALPQIRRGYVSTGDTHNHAASTEAGTGSITMDWTLGQDGYWAIAAMEIKASGSGTNMTYTSSTATQNTNPVNQGDLNQQIIGMQVVTTGTLNPLSVSEFRLRTDGTTNYATDITNMRVYYTGTNSTFSETGQFGTVQNPLAPGNDVTFTGTQTLASGTNYFWLTYDITAGATVGNVVDAIFQRVNVGGTLNTPSTTNPSGNRPIQGSGTNMTYSSSTVTQASTADVYTGSVNQQIIRVQVVTSGTANPLNATSFRLRTNGSTNPVNDINNAKIYYTGSSATFATTTLFGTNSNPPAINTDYTISGTQQLVQGNNYFWVTYDIEPTATVNNDVDALCNQITVGGANYTPSQTDPPDARKISCTGDLQISVTKTDVLCYGSCTGKAAVTIINGVNPPFSYLWNDPNSQTTDTAINLCAGNYTVTVTDNMGTTNTITIVITQPTYLVSIITINDSSCYNGCTGKATVTAIGSIPPYTYRWMNGETKNVASNLCSGSNFVTITDKNNCFIVDTINIPSKKPIKLTLILTNETFEGACDGQAAITNPSEYICKWSNGQISDIAMGLCSGATYYITATNASGCIAIDSFTISYDIPVPEICIITIDPDDDFNMVVWEKPVGPAIKEYRVYKESAVAGFYNIIGIVPYDSLSVYTDDQSNPHKKSDKYKLSCVDQHGTESTISDYHKSIHLTANMGVPSGVNLIWSHYEGFPFFTYRIFRGTSKSLMTQIDSVASTLNSYTDVNPPLDTLYYMVAAVKPDTCNPIRVAEKKGPFSQSTSNIEEKIYTGISDLSFEHNLKIYPNPFNEKTSVEFYNPDHSPYQFEMTDIAGRTVKQAINITSNRITITRDELNPGFYFISLNGKYNFKEKVTIY